MKQGTVITKLVMIFLAVAVVFYFALSAWNSLTDPFSTTLSYAYTIDISTEVTGLLVREEYVLPSAVGSVEQLPEEGERVSVGQAVAAIYQNDAALQRKEEIYSLTMGLAQLEYALAQDGQQQDSAKLSAEIIDSMVDIHVSAASKSLLDLDDQTFLLKSLVYEREYAYGDEASTAGLEQAIAEKTAQIAALQSQSATDTSYIWSDRTGTFSRSVDGFEYTLTPDMLSTLTPSQLTQISNQAVGGDSTAVGKLITDNTWYFTFVIGEDASKEIYEGATLTVRFSHDWSGDVEMDVESVSNAEDGQVVVVLSTNRYLSSTSLLREQTVELVFETITGVRVPREALRVLQVEETDEDGNTYMTQVTGVYALVGEQAEFKPAEVLLEEDYYCLLSPTVPDGTKEILRAGDQIIVAASDLYDGKVIG